jgi:hypothetical protein
MMVMVQDCDVLWDFQARFPTEEAQEAYGPEADDIDTDKNCLSRLLLCDVFEHDEIRDRVAGSDVWRRIKQNQDERYHHFPEAPIGDGEDGAEFPDLYLDFKKTLALPTRQLYEGIRDDGVTRRAVVPPIFLHDLAHRFFGYLSRVALPVP